MTSCSLTRIAGLLQVRVASEGYASFSLIFLVSPSISMLSEMCALDLLHERLARMVLVGIDMRIKCTSAPRPSWELTPVQLSHIETQTLLLSHSDMPPRYASQRPSSRQKYRW